MAQVPGQIVLAVVVTVGPVVQFMIVIVLVAVLLHPPFTTVCCIVYVPAVKKV